VQSEGILVYLVSCRMTSFQCKTCTDEQLFREFVAVKKMMIDLLDI
jgi:hypothetical protein